MAKDKIVEKTSEIITKKSNIILQYMPLILGLICLLICYLLFKKMQTLSSQSNSISKVEKQFTNFAKEQEDVNGIYNKKFNNLISQINQIGYIVQNSQQREVNNINTQMSPEKEKTEKIKKNISSQQEIPQQEIPQQEIPQQRELMPSGMMQTNHPINLNNENNNLSPPMNTSIKKEQENNNLLPQMNTSMKQENNNDNTKQLNKKVIDIHTLKEEVMIEEVTSDEE